MRKKLSMYLTLTDAAELLRLHPESVRRAAAKGQIPGQKIGGSWRFSRKAIDDYLQRPYIDRGVAGRRKTSFPPIKEVGSGSSMSKEDLEEYSKLLAFKKPGRRTP